VSQAKPQGRWADDPQPVVTSTPATYAGTPEGPTRRAELHTPDGRLLGHVWTDDQKAAGFLNAESAGPEGVRAGAKVWAILRDAYRAGKPARDALNPALYRPHFTLGPVGGDTNPGKQIDDAIRAARGRKTM
jgi:hypothetical protein